MSEFGKWESIETAPTDAVTVLTQHVDDLFPVSAFCIEGEWLRQTEGPEDIEGEGKWLPLYRTPTHWMPLPPPPTE